MSKCDNCDKNITKRSPGLECGKCGKIVHANQICSGLTAKQLAALRNSESLEWTCQECHRESPKRKSSFIIPEDDDDEEEDSMTNKVKSANCTIDADKFMHDITNELKKIMKKQLEPIENSTNMCCKKIEDLSGAIEAQNKKLRDVEKKCINLNNKHTNLELKVGILEQQLRDMEQHNLKNVVEVVGLPKVKDLGNVTSTIANQLKKDDQDVNRVMWIEGRNGKNGFVQMIFTNAEQADAWVRAAKQDPVLVENLSTDAPVEVAKSRIILRKALTKYNKALLWKAQQSLKPTYKYVWFQDGKVLARKADNDKPSIIRSEEDIISILSDGAGSASQR